ncbi:MAG: hypothetical protein WCI17_00520 [bacterium]
MRTVLHIGSSRTWTEALGPVPWPLAPIGNRPLLEYWLEWSVDLGVSEVQLVLGDGADQIEAYAGDGSRWGLHIQYSFLRADRPPLSFLQRAPGKWRDGLLFLSGPLFPRRLSDARPARPAADGMYLHTGAGGSVCALCRDAASLERLLAGPPDPAQTRPFCELGLELAPVESCKEFFELNMLLAAGEISRYLAPGYGAADGSCVGYNVVIPPSAEVAPSVILGNDCRIGALASVGPSVVVGSHVFIDRQAHLQRCVMLDGTYVGRQVELQEKIASGNRLIDPADGEALELTDTWLLAGMKPAGKAGDACRGAAGWVLALLLLVGQLVPFTLLYGAIRLCGLGRFERRQVYGLRRRVVRMRVFRPAARAREPLLVSGFYALGLDLAPRLLGAVRGQWRLCGHEPLRAEEDHALRDELATYFPGVFSYATARRGRSDPDVLAVEARYYSHVRSIAEDCRILRAALAGRIFSRFGENVP